MMIKTYLPKEDDKLPDFYEVEIFFLGESKPIKLKLAGHKIVDKVFEPVFESSKTVGYKTIGVNSCPYLEYESFDDIIGLIPLSAIKHLSFDKNFSLIKDLKNKKGAISA